MTEEYLAHLSSFRFDPNAHVKLDFQGVRSGEKIGAIELSVTGLWVDTILYEVPLLALISEAYFKFSDVDWNHDDQEEKAYGKGIQLLRNGCIFSEFGSRRRRDYRTQDLVMAGLTRSGKEWIGHGGSFAGTSNVHFAMKYDVSPVGTVAHEWFMAIAAMTKDYRHANECALGHWVTQFGPGVLGIALTDTFGTPNFLGAFKQDSGFGRSLSGSKTATYAEMFAGVRQDSGDPEEFVKTMRNFYDSQSITERKTLIFSDSLNVDKCIAYKTIAEHAGFHPTFGVGTFFTSKCRLRNVAIDCG